MTQAGKVAEIFSTAGEAFTKLGNLAMALQPSSERSHDGGKWGEEEIVMLRKAVAQFGSDIEKISEQIRTKSANQIKSALKQKALQNLTVKPTGKTTPGSIITSQLSKSPMKMQNVARSIGQKSKIVNVPVMIAPQPNKKAKIDLPVNMNILTAIPQLKPMAVNSATIPMVASGQGFQVLLPQQPLKTNVIPAPIMQSAVIQKVADANTSGNVDVES